MSKVKNKISLKPLGENVIVQRLEEEETLKNGILLPDSAKKKNEKAKVIAIGKGKTTESGTTLPMPVKIGDIILMDKYSGQEISLENEEFIVLKASEITAIVEG